MRFVTREIESLLLSVFISVGIQWINFRENMWAFLRDQWSCPLHTCLEVCIKQVSVEQGSTVPFYVAHGRSQGRVSGVPEPPLSRQGPPPLLFLTVILSQQECNALEVMANERLFAGQYGDAAWSWDTDTKNKASGLAKAISSFSFIITLLTAMKCLSVLKPLRREI